MRASRSVSDNTLGEMPAFAVAAKCVPISDRAPTRGAPLQSGNRLGPWVARGPGQYLRRHRRSADGREYTGLHKTSSPRLAGTSAGSAASTISCGQRSLGDCPRELGIKDRNGLPHGRGVFRKSGIEQICMAFDSRAPPASLLVISRPRSQASISEARRSSSGPVKLPLRSGKEINLNFLLTYHPPPHPMSRAYNL